MSQTDSSDRVREWLKQTWPDAEIHDVTVDTGRDSSAWDVYLRGPKRFRIEVTGPLQAHRPSLEQRLREAAERREEFEANAPGTGVLTSDGIEFRRPKESP
jgi:hypothetical protein